MPTSLNPQQMMEELIAGRMNIKIRPKYARTVQRIIATAMDTFESDQTAEAKEYARRQLLQLAAEHDIRWLPDWIETPIEKLIVNIAVEVGWEFQKELRRSLAAAVASQTHAD